MAYIHGAYGVVNTSGAEDSNAISGGAFVYVGTAPIYSVTHDEDFDPTAPIAINNMAEAKEILGYSNDWAAYTLCEAMYVHFALKGLGPVVFINVLGKSALVNTDKTVTATTRAKTVYLEEGDRIQVDSITVKNGDTAVSAFTVSYDAEKDTIAVKVPSLTEETSLTVTYKTVDPSKVTTTDVIGTDDAGVKTGIQAIKNVYPVTGYIPAYLLAPGFSADDTIEEALHDVSNKINGHWDAWLLTDTEIASGSTDLDDVKARYYENETTYYPIVIGKDGYSYHLSVLAAANLQELLEEQDGIPYKTASNTEIEIAKSLNFGSAFASNAVFDEEEINEKLNSRGICSAVYSGGRWVIWGAHAASYSLGTNKEIDVAETNRRMLYYISNDFQERRSADIDQPMSLNDLKMIVSEEQARLDSLINMGALTYGVVNLDAVSSDVSDIANGDYSFTFVVTTTPIAKSLTAKVNWSDKGLTTYFSTEE